MNLAERASELAGVDGGLDRSVELRGGEVEGVRDWAHVEMSRHVWEHV